MSLTIVGNSDFKTKLTNTQPREAARQSAQRRETTSEPMGIWSTGVADVSGIRAVPSTTSVLPPAPSAGRTGVSLRGMSKARPEEVVIIGSGPGGHTAALYTARAGLNPLLFEGNEPGGQLLTTTTVENYPGFPEGIDGYDLITAFRQQSERFGTRMIAKNVESVDFSVRPFELVADGKTHYAKAVIVATGASPRHLDVNGEQRLANAGVSYCATCDGPAPAFRNKEVVVVGGGDSAMEEALFLSRFASKVTIVHRRNEYRASRIMLDRARANEKIELLTPYVVDGILGDEHVTGVKLRNTETGEVDVKNVAGVFIAIGHRPNSQIFRDQLEISSSGHILTQGKSSRTSVEGVFACGDVQDPSYRQAITAAGSGCKAALDAERWLAAIESSNSQTSTPVGSSNALLT